MPKIIDLRNFIKSYLKTKHPTLFFQSAPDDATFPYVVYDLPNSLDDGSMERFILDIDVWDDNKDTTELETLIDDIDKGLHRKTVMLGEISVTFYRENRLSLTDPDSRIRRRKYVYQIRTHE